MSTYLEGLEVAAQLVESEYAHTKEQHERLKQIAGHIRDLAKRHAARAVPSAIKRNMDNGSDWDAAFAASMALDEAIRERNVQKYNAALSRFASSSIGRIQPHDVGDALRWGKHSGVVESGSDMRTSISGAFDLNTVAEYLNGAVAKSDRPTAAASTVDGPLGGFATVGREAAELDLFLTQLQVWIEEKEDEDESQEDRIHAANQALELKREIIDRYAPSARAPLKERELLKAILDTYEWFKKTDGLASLWRLEGEIEAIRAYFAEAPVLGMPLMVNAGWRYRNKKTGVVTLTDQPPDRVLFPDDFEVTELFAQDPIRMNNGSSIELVDTGGPSYQSATMICPKCGTDRFKEACPHLYSSPLNCPMVGDASGPK